MRGCWRTTARSGSRARRAPTLPAKPHDGHASLGWDDEFRGLVDACAAGRLAARLADFRSDALVLGTRRRAAARRPRRVRGAGAGSAPSCRHAVSTPAKLDAASPYQMPHNVVALGARYSIEELVDPLNAIAVWFSNGNAMLNAIRDGLVKRRLKAPEVRCWPHHFDMDSLIQLGGDRAVGSGFCPATSSATSRISIFRSTRSRTFRRCRCCRRSGTGTPTSSSRRWRPRTRSSPRSTSRATSPASSTFRSTRRSKRSNRVGRLSRSR